jgi:MFS family permease
VEAFTLLVLSPLITRLGIKNIMVIGLIAWVGRYVCFAYGYVGDQPIKWCLLLGLLMHGLSYDFFFVAGQIWLEKNLGPTMRNRAQSLHSFILYGVGVIVGANVAGFVFTRFTDQAGVRDWWMIWMVPAVITLITLFFFVFHFNERNTATKAEKLEHV